MLIPSRSVSLKVNADKPFIAGQSIFKRLTGTLALLFREVLNPDVKSVRITG
jgi:hypothetical protein